MIVSEGVLPVQDLQRGKQGEHSFSVVFEVGDWVVVDLEMLQFGQVLQDAQFLHGLDVVGVER